MGLAQNFHFDSLLKFQFILFHLIQLWLDIRISLIVRFFIAIVSAQGVNDWHLYNL